jgi:hypothetical protein
MLAIQSITGCKPKALSITRTAGARFRTSSMPAINELASAAKARSVCPANNARIPCMAIGCVSQMTTVFFN